MPIRLPDTPLQPRLARSQSLPSVVSVLTRSLRGGLLAGLLASSAWATSPAPATAPTPAPATTSKHAPTAGTPSRAAIEARYQAERQACLDGRSGQDQPACLKEAAAARSEALRQQLGNGEDRATRRANALARCQVQPAAEREACERLARGEGSASGSVRDGGVLRQLVTRSPGSAAAASVPH